jgi:hypothetical protein
MRMLRRLSILAAALLFAGTAASAASLDREMREVERLRGLTFLHGVKERTIDRSQLRPLIREQLSKEIPYSLDDYIRVLENLQLIDRSTHDVLGKRSTIRARTRISPSGSFRRPCRASPMRPRSGSRSSFTS